MDKNFLKRKKFFWPVAIVGATSFAFLLFICVNSVIENEKIEDAISQIREGHVRSIEIDGTAFADVLRWDDEAPVLSSRGRGGSHLAVWNRTEPSKSVIRSNIYLPEQFSGFRSFYALLDKFTSEGSFDKEARIKSIQNFYKYYGKGKHRLYHDAGMNVFVDRLDEAALMNYQDAISRRKKGMYYGSAFWSGLFLLFLTGMYKEYRSLWR